MIFVTVGSQMPFDRLVRTVDEWAGQAGRKDVFAQVGPKSYQPLHMEYAQDLTPGDFRMRMTDAELVIAHAGMGTIITAMELARPLLLMPRRGDLAETRNDHQFATAKRFLERGVVVAWDEGELRGWLDRLDEACSRVPIAREANRGLIQSVRAFIGGGSAPARESDTRGAGGGLG